MHTHHENHPFAEDFGPGSPRGDRRDRPRRGHGHGRGRGPMGPGFGPGAGAGPGAEGFFGPAFGPGFGLGRRGARRGPGRGRRGDVRNAVLALLAEGPRNGYQVIREIAERTEGLWRPSAGSVYPALGLLQDEGLIREAVVDGKKAFELTEDGRNHVEEHAEELKDPWAKVAQPVEGFLDVRQEVGQLAMALHQVVVAGSTEQVAQARGVLDEARKSIYRILADG